MNMKYFPVIPIFLLLALLAHGADIVLRGTQTIGGGVPADVYLASNQTFTGTNTFSVDIQGTATNANTVGGELPADLHDAANLTGTASAIDGSAIFNVDALTLGGYLPSEFVGAGDVLLGNNQTFTGTNTFTQTILGTASNATALHGNTNTPLYAASAFDAAGSAAAVSNALAAGAAAGLTALQAEADTNALAVIAGHTNDVANPHAVTLQQAVTAGGTTTLPIGMNINDSGNSMIYGMQGWLNLGAASGYDSVTPWFILIGTNTFDGTFVSGDAIVMSAGSGKFKVVDKSSPASDNFTVDASGNVYWRGTASGTATNATTVGGELPSAFQDASANLTTLATLNGGSLTNLKDMVQYVPYAIPSASTVTVSEAWTTNRFMLNMTNNVTLAVSNVDTNKAAGWVLDVKMNSYTLTFGATITNLTTAANFTRTNSYQSIVGNRPIYQSITEVW